MKRGGFKPKVFQRPPRAPLVPIVREVVVVGSVTIAQGRNAGTFNLVEPRALVSIPKGVKAKPGKRAPTVEEQRWIRAMQDFGCFACWCDGTSRVPGEYHHVVEAGRRLGHGWGYLLCSPGHHQPDSRSGKVSIHPGRRPAFIARYGAERDIVARLRSILGFPPP